MQQRLIAQRIIFNIVGLSFVFILSALCVGAAVGYVLQRGRGCTNTAFRNIFLIGNLELALMLVVVVTIEIMGYFFLSLDVIPGFTFSENPIPLSYILVPVGGFLFGLGTVFAGGCAGGTCYRIGEGSAASVLAFVGYAGGIGLVGVILKSQVDLFRAKTLVTINGQTPTLDLFLPRWVWTIVAALVLSLTLLYYKHLHDTNKLKLQHLLPRWTPILTGLILGLLGITARYFSTLSGRSFGLSTTDGIAEIFQTVLFIGSMGWAGYMIVGLILGSALSATLGREFTLSFPSATELIRFFGGGLLLGIGAMLGLGCNFGHIFGGMPELGISSFISVVFMMLGNWTASSWFYNRLGHELPLSTPA